MKKLIIPILALILSGSFYFFVKNNVSNDNTGSETVTQTNNNAISTTDVSTQSVTDENKNKSNKEEIEKVTISSKSHEIVNPITGETHPASYYDEILADGYTYNNPAPIPENWIIEPATDEYPATLDYDKLKDTLPESYIHNGRITKHFTMVPDYMIGYNPRILLLNTEQKFATKKDFLNWLSNYIDSDIYFISESEFDNKNGGTNWNIFIKSSNIEDVYNSYDNLTKEEKLYMRVSSFYLPKYKGTKELEDAVQATMNAMTE